MNPMFIYKPWSCLVTIPVFAPFCFLEDKLGNDAQWPNVRNYLSVGSWAACRVPAHPNSPVLVKYPNIVHFSFYELIFLMVNNGINGIHALQWVFHPSPFPRKKSCSASASPEQMFRAEKEGGRSLSSPKLRPFLCFQHLIKFKQSSFLMSWPSLGENEKWEKKLKEHHSSRLPEQAEKPLCLKTTPAPLRLCFL